MKLNNSLLGMMAAGLVGLPDALKGSGETLTIKEMPQKAALWGFGGTGYKYRGQKGAFGKCRGSKRALRFLRGQDQGKTGAFESRMTGGERFKDRAGSLYVRCENGQMRRIYGSNQHGWKFVDCGKEYVL